MKVRVEISDEALLEIMSGKRIEGSLRMQPASGKQEKGIAFRAYQRLSRGNRRDRMVCQLENGWLKESAKRYKFFNSVKKELGISATLTVMKRELEIAMHELSIERIIDTI